MFIGRTDAEAETPIFLPPDVKNWLVGKRQEKRGTTGWDGWMASPIWWISVWASSGSWRWTGRPGMLQSMGSQRVGHDWVTELNWYRILGCSFLYLLCSYEPLFNLLSISPKHVDTLHLLLLLLHCLSLWVYAFPPSDSYCGVLEGTRDKWRTSLVAQMVKKSAYNTESPGLIPGSGRSPGE